MQMSESTKQLLRTLYQLTLKALYFGVLLFAVIAFVDNRFAESAAMFAFLCWYDLSPVRRVANEINNSNHD